MSVRSQLFHFFGNLVFKQPAKQKSFDQLITALEKTCDQILGRVAHLPDDDHNRRVLSHIIGIERWSQRRLRVALGDPLIKEEYNGYRPGRDVTVPALREMFAHARQDTIAIAHQVKGVGDDVMILHNDYGQLSVKAWLHYLNTHAFFESKKLRG